MKSMPGIIGGSGISRFDGLEQPAWRRVETPWGDPSGELLLGQLDGAPVAFLPRPLAPARTSGIRRSE